MFKANSFKSFWFNTISFKCSWFNTNSFKYLGLKPILLNPFCLKWTWNVDLEINDDLANEDDLENDDDLVNEDDIENENDHEERVANFLVALDFLWF